MQQQPLTADLSLLIETSGKNLRLVITNGTEELACRKETPGKLRRFLASEEKDLFKGRLQLRKNGDAISVLLKGNTVGIVKVDALQNML